MARFAGPVVEELSATYGVEVIEPPAFSSLTTMRIGGTPRGAVRASTSEALAKAFSLLDDASIPLLVVGGGSNLVVADGELDYVVVLARNEQVTVGPGGVMRAEAGAVWDDVVARAVNEGLGGIEALSGIPGSAGAVPVQNVGAYGAEISDVLTRVKLYNRETGTTQWVPASDLDLAYRYSNLKFTNRAVVLEIEMQLDTTGISIPLRHMQGRQVSVAAARDSVLELRRSKGMVLDAADHDTWSAGSFFTNPVVDSAVADRIDAQVGEAGMPRFPQPHGGEKLSAAWLIERAGFQRGFPSEEAPARLSTKHTLALTNRGEAAATDIRDLARTVRAGVEDAFGVRLVPEPVWVGMSIDEDEG